MNKKKNITTLLYATLACTALMSVPARASDRASEVEFQGVLFAHQNTRRQLNEKTGALNTAHKTVQALLKHNTVLRASKNGIAIGVLVNAGRPKLYLNPLRTLLSPEAITWAVTLAGSWVGGRLIDWDNIKARETYNESCDDLIDFLNNGDNFAQEPNRVDLHQTLALEVQTLQEKSNGVVQLASLHEDILRARTLTEELHKFGVGGYTLGALAIKAYSSAPDRVTERITQCRRKLPEKVVKLWQSDEQEQVGEKTYEVIVAFNEVINRALPQDEE